MYFVVVHPIHIYVNIDWPWPNYLSSCASTHPLIASPSVLVFTRALLQVVAGFNHASRM